MRIVFAVLLLCVALAASYPSHHADDDEETNGELELELRSILDQLTGDQIAQSSNEDDDDEEETGLFSKRQGGHNIVNKGTKCEIECVAAERNPKRGKGKTIKEAAKVCKNRCLIHHKKNPITKDKPKHGKHIKTRAFIDEDDDSRSDEDQNVQRREFYDYLMEQIQRNNE